MWFVYAFTETENCDWLGLQAGRFRLTWTAVIIARTEMCQENVSGPGNWRMVNGRHVYELGRPLEDGGDRISSDSDA